MANDQEVKYLVPGLERGLQLLLAFGEQHRDLTFAELHRLVDMPKATAYRVVQTLEYMGFLERNARANTFSLGMNVLRLGFEYIASLDVAQVGQPVIEQLRDISKCSSHLAIRDGRDIIYIARVSAARFAYQPGQRRNAATGALHLAWPHAADRCFPQRV
ncbi:Transcriptional regulator, IclR family [Klebsiella pneumoniae IS10]|nr:Transcriptional regulator, IclR family [Klebsiella pneumoniae IS10]